MSLHARFRIPLSKTWKLGSLITRRRESSVLKFNLRVNPPRWPIENYYTTFDMGIKFDSLSAGAVTINQCRAKYL